MNTETIEAPTIGTCSFLCMLGDITISWDNYNREQVLELVRKKMKEGYSFFTTKKFMFNKLKREVKITEKNIDVTEEIIITDEQFEKMISDMDDRDIASLVKNENVNVIKRKGKSELTLMQRAQNAEDVIDKDSVAIRPIVGG